MIITLSGLFIQRRFKKKERLFNVENRILTQKDIENLSDNKDVSKAIEAFQSAVINHDAVEYQGCVKRLHTSYPTQVRGVYLGAGHDGFRRAEIAYQIGNLASKIKNEEIKKATDILETLVMKHEKRYTQILALNSLGILGKRIPSLFKDMECHLKKDLSDFSHYPIGTLTFLENAKSVSMEKTIQILDEAKNSATTKNRMFIGYFTAKNNLIPRTMELQKFLSELSSYSEEDVIRGLELTELIGPCPPFMKNTPQAKIYSHLAETCLNLIGVAGYIDRLSLKEDYEPPFRRKNVLIEQGY